MKRMDAETGAGLPQEWRVRSVAYGPAAGRYVRVAEEYLRSLSVRETYLLLTYFSRRICGTGRPASFSDSKHASTMFGLPHK